MRADLHMHSVFSDGKYTPEELARRAKEAGLSLFSLTDHDSMEGSEAGRLAALRYGLHYVQGWEVSAYEGACQVHILGYGCKKGDLYADFLRERFSGAIVRAKDMLQKANDIFGLDVTLDEIEAYHVRKDSPLHTIHVVKAFADRLGRDSGELYHEAFARGGPAFSDACRPSPQDAINVIHGEGGIAVLAHPGRILDLPEEELQVYRNTQDDALRAELKKKSDAFRLALMDRLVAMGLDGIECIYTTHTVIETAYFLDYARANDLLVTGGSDFHMDGRKNALGLPVFETGDALAQVLLRLDGSV